MTVGLGYSRNDGISRRPIENVSLCSSTFDRDLSVDSTPRVQ